MKTDQCNYTMNTSVTILRNKYGFEYPFRSDPFLEKAVTYLKNGKNLLDVGCGEGADSVYFAQKGYRVTAIDNNKIYLDRFRAFVKDHKLTTISIAHGDVINYQYRQNYYDVVNCLLVGCCMKRSEFERMLTALKRTVKSTGIIIMTLRNYLDPEFTDYVATESMIEPNTFRKREDCYKIKYYIEKNRLRDLFSDFEILYYYEGLLPDKYNKVEEHGDSYIICKHKT